MIPVCMFHAIISMWGGMDAQTRVHVQVCVGVCAHGHVCECAGVCLWVCVHECVCVCTCRYGVLRTHLYASTGGGQMSVLDAVPHEPSTLVCFETRSLIGL